MFRAVPAGRRKMGPILPFFAPRSGAEFWPKLASRGSPPRGLSRGPGSPPEGLSRGPWGPSWEVRPEGGKLQSTRISARTSRQNVSTPRFCMTPDSRGDGGNETKEFPQKSDEKFDMRSLVGTSIIGSNTEHLKCGKTPEVVMLGVLRDQVKHDFTTLPSLRGPCKRTVQV